jgi:hypothetical protein
MDITFKLAHSQEFQAVDAAAQRHVEGRYKRSVASVSLLLRTRYPRVFR